VDGVPIPRDQGTGRCREGPCAMQGEMYLGGHAPLNLGGWIHMRMVTVCSSKVRVKFSRHHIHTSIIVGGIIKGYPNVENCGRMTMITVITITITMQGVGCRVVTVR